MIKTVRLVICSLVLVLGPWNDISRAQQSAVPPKVEPKVDPKAAIPANATGKTGEPLELKANTAGEIDWEIPGEFHVRLIPAEKVVILVPKAGGTYVVRLAVCEDGKPRIYRCVVFVEGFVPPLPPEPGPSPKPDDKKPIPTPDGGLRVLLVRETMSRYTAEQIHIINSTKVAAYLNAKCAKGDGGQPGWRVWDPQQDVTNADPIMRQLFNDTKSEATKSLPALVIASGKQAVVYPLPATEADMLTLLKKYGGE